MRTESERGKSVSFSLITKRLRRCAITFYSSSFFLSSLCNRAQERFIDDTFEVHEVKTRTYAVKDREELILDIYEPQNDEAQERPVLIFMHGGGFPGGSPKNESEVKFAEIAAARGYVAIQVSYRLTRKDKSLVVIMKVPVR